jgi:hypothetical protein
VVVDVDVADDVLVDVLVAVAAPNGCHIESPTRQLHQITSWSALTG